MEDKLRGSSGDATARLKTGAKQPQAKPHLRRAEFFTLPITSHSDAPFALVYLVTDY